MRYLLDTNTMSDLVRTPQGIVARRIAAVGHAQVCTSIIVAAEMRFGATKKRSAALLSQLETILGSTLVLPLEPPMDAVYGELRATLEAKGTPIGGNDLLIAAQALALGLTLVTGNVREFTRVDGLTVENWLA